MNSRERNIDILEHIIKYCAHKYGDISITTLWETITDDIPLLFDYCNSVKINILE